jgi:hypothetical protein
LTDEARTAVVHFLARYRHSPGLVAVAIGLEADLDAGGRREAIIAHAETEAAPFLRAERHARFHRGT